MSSLRDLYRNASHYLAGNFGVMVLGFISFPLFTRSISVSQYGELNIALRIVLLMVIFAKIGLPHSMVRFYAEDAQSSDPAIVAKYYSTFILTGIGAALALCAVYLLAVLAIPATALNGSLRFLLLAGTVMIFANAMNSLLTGVLRAGGRSKEFAGIQLVVKVLAIATSLILLYTWERSARALLTSNVLAELATFAALLVLFLRQTEISLRRFDRAYARQIIAFALPLIVFELASAVLDSGDRLLIKYFLGEESVGLYSAAYNVSSYLQDLIFASLNLALVPLYLKIWNTQGKDETEKFLSSGLNDFVLVCCLLCCGTAVCSGDALILLASKKYADAAQLVPYLVIGMVLYTFTTFFNAGLYLNKRSGVMASIVASSAILNLVLNVVFLPRFGIVAAVWATIVSFAFLLGVVAWKSRAYMRLDVDLLGGAAGIVSAVVSAVVISRLDFNTPIANIVVKGALSVLVYAVLLLALHARVRTRLLTALRPA